MNFKGAKMLFTALGELSYRPTRKHEWPVDR